MRMPRESAASMTIRDERGDGVHRHLALVMLAYTFLMLQSLGHELHTDPAVGGASPQRARSAFRLATSWCSSCFPEYGLMDY